MSEVESDMVVNAVKMLVGHNPEEIAPYALPIITKLVREVVTKCRFERERPFRGERGRFEGKRSFRERGFLAFHSEEESVCASGLAVFSS